MASFKQSRRVGYAQTPEPQKASACVTVDSTGRHPLAAFRQSRRVGYAANAGTTESKDLRACRLLPGYSVGRGQFIDRSRRELPENR